MGPLDSDGDGANTPLTDEILAGLVPSWVTTREDLNEVEAINVAAGYRWLRSKLPTTAAILTTEFAQRLHQQMFGDVWEWAGTFRRSEINIGVDPWTIEVEVRQLVDDFNYRFEHAAPMGSTQIDQFCVEYHHRMVKIHPFPNGNGRHARACGDALALSLDQPAFTWGGASIVTDRLTRGTYIEAIRAADDGNLTSLCLFARS
jgi:Fic-DOC domain mobile mystery protein B